MGEPLRKQKTSQENVSRLVWDYADLTVHLKGDKVRAAGLKK